MGMHAFDSSLQKEGQRSESYADITSTPENKDFNAFDQDRAETFGS
jgi:hypothetical protein